MCGGESSESGDEVFPLSCGELFRMCENLHVLLHSLTDKYSILKREFTSLVKFFKTTFIELYSVKKRARRVWKLKIERLKII